MWVEHRKRGARRDRRVHGRASGAKRGYPRCGGERVRRGDHALGRDRRGPACGDREHAWILRGRTLECAILARSKRNLCMKTLRSYLGGRWVAGSGAPQTLVNPATEEALAQASSEGLDLAAAMDHARREGGPALRALSFAERGALLKEMANAIQAHRDELLDLAVANGGNTRSDAKFDVDGAIFTLQTYAEIGASLGTAKFLVDGEGVQLGRSPRFHGQHINVPRHGVAVQLNAITFPAWVRAEMADSGLRGTPRGVDSEG